MTDRTAERGSREWVNRDTDAKSRRLTIATLSLAWIASSVGYGAACLVFPRLTDPLLLLWSPILFALFYFALIGVQRFRNHFLLTIIPVGTIAIIKLRGESTGEFANSGVLQMPLFYRYELIDARQTVYEVGPLRVRSVDSFIVTATAKSGVSIKDSNAVLQVENHEILIKSLLTSAVHSAVSRSEALRIIGDRDEVNRRTLTELNGLLGNSGMSADYLNIDVIDVPEQLSGMVAVLGTVQSRYPSIDHKTLVDILLAEAGKLAISRNESLQTHKFDAPGLDHLLAAVTARIG